MRPVQLKRIETALRQLGVAVRRVDADSISASVEDGTAVHIIKPPARHGGGYVVSRMETLPSAVAALNRALELLGLLRPADDGSALSAVACTRPDGGVGIVLRVTDSQGQQVELVLPWYDAVAFATGIVQAVAGRVPEAWDAITEVTRGEVVVLRRRRKPGALPA